MTKIKWFSSGNHNYQSLLEPSRNAVGVHTQTYAHTCISSDPKRASKQGRVGLSFFWVVVWIPRRAVWISLAINHLSRMLRRDSSACPRRHLDPLREEESSDHQGNRQKESDTAPPIPSPAPISDWDGEGCLAWC